MTRRVRIPGGRTRRPGAVRAHRAGDVLHCLVLARGPEEWVAVDVTTGALVRTHPDALPIGAAPAAAARTARLPVDEGPPGAASSDVGGEAEPHLDDGEIRPERLARELELVEVVLAEDAEPPDPARPEAVTLASPPVVLGAPRRRVVRKVLRSLVGGDPKRPLLGTLGPSIAYEDLDGTRPSIAVVVPDRLPMFATDSRGSWCQFTLGGRKHRLTVIDERVVAATSGRRGELLGTDSVTAAIGGQPRFLVIGLGTPYLGQAPKLVVSVLPRT